LAQSGFSALALDELPNLPANRSEHFEDVRVRLANFPAEKLDHSQHVFSEPNGKRESAVQPRLVRQRGARKILVARHIGDPMRFARGPNASGQTNSAAESNVARRLPKFAELARSRVPHIHAAKEIPVDMPNGPEIPAQAYAYRLENLRCGIGKRRRVREHACHRELCRAAQFSLLA
jgi:hypothetical protein